jgi:hypothetical protein
VGLYLPSLGRHSDGGVVMSILDRVLGNIEARIVAAPFWTVAISVFVGMVLGVALS